MKSSAARKETLTYRWFRFSIALGAGLAILLLVNSVASYFLGLRRVLVEQLRHDLARQAVSLDRRIQQAGNAQDLSSLFEQVRQNNDGKTAWIEIRDAAGGIVAHSGLAAGPVFPAEFVRSQLRNRQPIFKTVKTGAGQVVAEVFPLRLPASLVSRTPVTETGPPRQLGIIEMALFLDGRGAAFWPLRRNLLINCLAVLALRVSLTVMSVRFRSYVEGKQLEKQVEIARQVQQDLLSSPNQLPEEFQLAAEYVPAARVGGDFLTYSRSTATAPPSCWATYRGKEYPQRC